MNFLDWVLVGTLAAIFLMYVVYLVVLRVFISFSHRSGRTLANRTDLPFLSVIVPTYNEATSIAAKLENLLSVSYPKDKHEIIVVDSGSTDDTLRIAEEYEKRGVILLKQEKRWGKANAINSALQRVKGGIVVLTDANSFFGPDSLRMLVEKFDERTGAVLPRLVPSGKLSYWDEAFHEVHHLYKNLESKADSVFIVFGELFAFRRDLIDKVDEDAAADDLSIALSIRSKNYRIVYSPDVQVVERVPNCESEVRAQKTRRVFGIAQAMTKNFYFFLNPRYGIYGMLIFPTHFIQITVGPFLVFSFLAVLVGKLYVTIAGNFEPLVGAALLSVICGLFILLYFLSSVIRKAFSFGYNFLATQLYIVIALANLARGKKFSVWEKISSTREISAD